MSFKCRYLCWFLKSPRRVSTESAGPGPGPSGQRSPLLRSVVQTADGSLAGAGHEGDDGEQGRPDGPGGLPGLGVVAGDGQTNLLTDLEPSVGLKIFELTSPLKLSSIFMLLKPNLKCQSLNLCIAGAPMPQRHFKRH